MGSACTGSGPDERLHSTDYDSLTISKSIRNAVRILDFFSTYMFFMHGGAGYTRFIQNIGTAFTDGVFLFSRFLIIPKIITGFVLWFSLRLQLLFLCFIAMRCNHAMTVSFSLRKDILCLTITVPRAGGSWIDDFIGTNKIGWVHDAI